MKKPYRPSLAQSPFGFRCQLLPLRGFRRTWLDPFPILFPTLNFIPELEELVHHCQVQVLPTCFATSLQGESVEAGVGEIVSLDILLSRSPSQPEQQTMQETLETELGLHVRQRELIALPFYRCVRSLGCPCRPPPRFTRHPSKPTSSSL